MTSFSSRKVILLARQHLVDDSALFGTCLRHKSAWKIRVETAISKVMYAPQKAALFTGSQLAACVALFEKETPTLVGR